MLKLKSIISLAAGISVLRLVSINMYQSIRISSMVK